MMTEKVMNDKERRTRDLSYLGMQSSRTIGFSPVAKRLFNLCCSVYP